MNYILGYSTTYIVGTQFDGTYTHILSFLNKGHPGLSTEKGAYCIAKLYRNSSQKQQSHHFKLSSAPYFYVS